ncbi:MAG: NADH-quinone oxidoreductase subunit M [Planctomycetaceae bacterium]|nr:NADH-quinone oxidoreductase subunit M [Planctomycetaceae bacterium]
MNSSMLLLISIVLPILGSVLICSLGAGSVVLVRRVALSVSLVTFFAAFLVVSRFEPAGDIYMTEMMDAVVKDPSVLKTFNPATTAFANTEYEWLPASTGIDVRFSIGLDGLSVWLYALSALLMLSAVLVSWTAIRERVALFFSMLLLLEAGCLGVFAARDLVLFYIFFEFTLIPLFFLIGIWGSEQRRFAAQKFFLFTLAGSLLTFLGLLTLVLTVHQQMMNGGMENGAISCSIPELVLRLTCFPLVTSLQFWVFLALFAGFAIKVPLFPLHTWLPLAHVQAPAAGSVFLAGILLKIGTFGFLRFNIPMLPEATAALSPLMLWLAVIGIIYGAFVALAQSDMKRLVAYSSVSHLGFCMLGLFALNPLGVQGATLQMINHGISTGALFALIGMLYERYHTREISDFGGLAKRLPVFAFFMLLFTFSSIGLPGLNGFAGEILILAGAFQRGWAEQAGPWGAQLKMISVLAVAGVVLGAWYMLSLVKRVFFGELKEPVGQHADSKPPGDLTGLEVGALVPLAILVFWIGLYPKFFLDRMQPALDYSTQAARQAVDNSPAKLALRQNIEESQPSAH